MTPIERLQREQAKAALIEKRIDALRERISTEFLIHDARRERIRQLFELHTLRMKFKAMRDQTVEFDTQIVKAVDLIPELRQTRRALISRILSVSKSVRRESCGVYFLTKGTSVVYVGKSRNVHARLEDHLKSKDFDGACFVRCNENELSDLENVYISILRPPLNMDVGTRNFRAVHGDPDDETN